MEKRITPPVAAVIRFDGADVIATSAVVGTPVSSYPHTTFNKFVTSGSEYNQCSSSSTWDDTSWIEVHFKNDTDTIDSGRVSDNRWNQVYVWYKESAYAWYTEGKTYSEYGSGTLPTK